MNGKASQESEKASRCVIILHGEALRGTFSLLSMSGNPGWFIFNTCRSVPSVFNHITSSSPACLVRDSIDRVIFGSLGLVSIASGRW